MGHGSSETSLMICENDHSKPTQLIWHYTTGVHIPSILQAGRIRNENPCLLKAPQVPVTWFSLNQVWEPTAWKVALPPETGATILREATAEVGRGLFRIGVDLCVAPFRVHHLIRIARSTRRTVKALARVGISCGACPEDWRFTPNHVPEEQWRIIQMWDATSTTWVPYRHGRLVPRRHNNAIAELN